jgi:hypothetical protein
MTTIPRNTMTQELCGIPINLTTEQQFFYAHPEFKGSVITEFKRNMFTGSEQAVVYDTQGNRLAIVSQSGYNKFNIYPTKD